MRKWAMTRVWDSLDQAMFTHANADCLLLDRDATILRVNERFARHRHRSEADLAGRPFSEVAPDPAILDGLKEAARTRRPLTVAAGDPRPAPPGAGEPGVWTWSLSPILDEAGELQCLFLSGVDAGERRRADEQPISEPLYQSVFESMIEGVVVLSADGAIIAANPAAERLLGLSSREMLGRDPYYPQWEALREDGTPFPGREHPAIVTLRTGQPQRDVVMGVRRPDGRRVWISINSQPVIAANETSPPSVVTTFHDVTERRAGEARQVEMIHELNHRVKNTLTLVQSIADQTLKTAASPADFTRAFHARLLALSRSHDVLTRTDWAGAQLRELVSEQLAPYQNGASQRFRLSGPAVRLPPKMAISLGVALSELATNAVKYGALSVDAGAVSVTWMLDRGPRGPCLKIVWREHNGPEVGSPTQRGLGTRLIERVLPYELGGSARMAFNPDGLTCEIELPLAGDAP